MLPNNLQNAQDALKLPREATASKQILHACRECGQVKLEGNTAWVAAAAIPHGLEDNLDAHYAILFVSSCTHDHA